MQITFSWIKDEGLCTSTEQTAGSSGLYSNAIDMAAWLKYLLGSRGAGYPRAGSGQRRQCEPS